MSDGLFDIRFLERDGWMIVVSCIVDPETLSGLDIVFLTIYLEIALGAWKEKYGEIKRILFEFEPDPDLVDWASLWFEDVFYRVPWWMENYDY